LRRARGARLGKQGTTAVPFCTIHAQRLVQGLRRGGDVVRIHKQSALRQFGSRAGLAGQHHRAGAIRQQRGFLGDQVHAVPDRVDQQHVGQPVRGERARIVVVDLQYQWIPVLGAELVHDLPRYPLHAGGVLAVLGQVVPGRVGERHVGDLAPPLWPGDQQFAVGGKATDDVLGQLGAVDPYDQLAIARYLVKRGDVCLHVLGRGAVAKLRRVHPERVDAHRGGVPGVPYGPRGPVHLGAEHGLAAVQERAGPALRVKPGMVGAEYALENLARHVVGQQREVIRRRPRGV